MDRVIKFRGKDKAGVWLFGVYCQDEECMITLVNDTYCFIKVIPETVGQFTGFKDIGGDDIYEGDIIQNNAHPELFYEVAMLGDGYWSGVLVNDEDENPSLAWLLETAPFVIIGNIHDTPELLGGGNDD